MENNKKSLEVFELLTSMKKIFGLLRDFHSLQAQNNLEAAILTFIKFHQGVDQAKIVDILKVPKQTVSYTICKLEKEGSIESKFCKNDKRRKTLNLTKNGQIYAEESLKPLMVLHKEIFDEMGEEKIISMKKDVKELTRLIEEKTRR